MPIIVFGRAVQVLLMLLTLKVSTALLSPAEYGRMSLLLALIAVFSSTLVNPVGMFINRRLHTWVSNGNLISYFKMYAFYLLLSCVIAIFVIALLKQYLGVISGMSLFWVASLTCLSLFFNTWNQTLIPALNLLSYRKSFIILTLLTLTASFLFSFLFTYGISASAQHWQLGQILGQAVIAVLSFVFFIHCVGWKKKPLRINAFNHKMILSLTTFALPISFAVGLNWVQTQSYRFVISSSLGLDILGLFVVGYAVSAAIIASVEAILTTYFLPDFYEQVASNDALLQAKAWNCYARAIYPCIILTTTCIIALSTPLCKFLLAEKFQSAHQYVLWGALAESGRVIIAAYSLIAHARMQTYRLILPYFIGGVSSLFFVIVLSKVFAIDGVGLALVLASVMVMLSLPFSLKGLLNVSFPTYEVTKALALVVVFVALYVMARLFLPEAMTLPAVMLFLSAFGMLYLFCCFVVLKPLIKV